MNDFDDDQLITGAFQQFTQAADPAVRPAGTAAVRGLAARHRRTRLTTLSVLAAIVIAAPVATYAALDQDNQGPPDPGSTPTATAHASPMPTSSPTNPATLPAFSVVYFAVNRADEPLRIYAFGPDGKADLLASIGPDQFDMIRHSISVAPNGTKLAWVDDKNDLYVANLDGSAKRKLASNVSASGNTAPVWSADSKSLITADRTIVVATGAVNGPGAVGTYLRWSANGQYYAYLAVGPPRVVVKRADGSLVKEVPFTCTDCESAGPSVLDVSEDGRYVAIGIYPTDGSRETSWDNLIDTQTGNVRPALAGMANSGRFLPGGLLLIAVGNELKVMDIDGHVNKSYPLPAELAPTGRAAEYKGVILGVR